MWKHLDGLDIQLIKHTDFVILAFHNYFGCEIFVLDAVLKSYSHDSLMSRMNN